MRENDVQLGKPIVVYKDTKANVEALTSVVEGSYAYSTDTNEPGWYDGAAWVWLDTANDATYLRLDTTNDPLTGALLINVNSAAALVVEQSGVKDDVLVVDTANGRVGIGTPSPVEQLHVYSAVGVIAELEANSANLVQLKLTRTDGGFTMRLGVDKL